MQKICAKVILFGEYAVLQGGWAFAIPLSTFSGKLSFEHSNDKNAFESNTQLSTYCKWLKEQSILHPYISILNLESDLNQGLWFDSNIPPKSGLGSSGAVVAALLKRYGNSSLAKLSVVELRAILSHFERYFHGTSSGIDPLISYLGTAVLLKGLDNIEVLGVAEDKKNTLFNPFLIPISGKGKTQDLVHVFNENWLDTRYSLQFKNNYIPRNNALISAFIQEDKNLFWNALGLLSESQMNMLPDMLDEDFKKMMQMGISSGTFGVKICGSGGGGFALGFAQTTELINTHFPSAIPL